MEAAVPLAESCSTFPANTIAASLNAADQLKACNEYAACDMRPYQADPAGMFCDILAMLGVALGDGGFLSDTEVRVACKEKKAACLADPNSLAQGQQVLQSSLKRTCPSPVTCTWTMGKLDACWKATRKATAGLSPTCETITVAQTKPKTSADAAVLNLPAECQPIDDATCLQLFSGVTTR